MYFDNFKKKDKTVSGIPNIKMNKTVSGRPIKKGDVGIEFEFEASNSLPWDVGQINQTSPCPITGGIWTAKEDNSLRGGVEYVTSQPVSIETVPGLVKGLYTSLADFKTKLKLSNRCSTHVHLNATTWKIDRFISFYMVWALLEPLLIDWCGPRRKLNHFCLSILDSPSTLNVITSFLKNGEWRLSDGDKYSALNIRRLWDIGTVEVRCGDAWTDPEKAITWIKFLHGIVQYTEGLYPTEIPARVSGDTAVGVIAEICNLAETPEMYQDLVNLFNEDEITSKAMTSFREVIHLAYLPAWGDWRSLINQEYIHNPFESGRAKGGDGVAPMRFNRINGAANGVQLLREWEQRIIDERPFAEPAQPNE